MHSSCVRPHRHVCGCMHSSSASIQTARIRSVCMIRRLRSRMMRGQCLKCGTLILLTHLMPALRWIRSGSVSRSTSRSINAFGASLSTFWLTSRGGKRNRNHGQGLIPNRALNVALYMLLKIPDLHCFFPTGRIESHLGEHWHGSPDHGATRVLLWVSV